jgi:hypothetical protein
MNDKMKFDRPGFFLVILFVVLTLQSINSIAQSFQPKSKVFYRGLQVNYATRSFTIASDIPAINQSRGTLAGGQIGLVLGNEVLRAKVGLLGYYSSGGNTKGTIELYQTNTALNFYPLALLNKKGWRIQPYVLGSVAFDRFKFYGYYLDNSPGIINYSCSLEPYLATIKQINATVGTGLEFKLLDKFDFVHFFTEVRYGHSLSSKSTSAQFDHTSLGNQMQVIAGISFGARH